jgi:hypothetical protein
VSAFTLWKKENVNITKRAEFLEKFKSSDIRDGYRPKGGGRASNARINRCVHRRCPEFSVQTKGAPEL